MRLLAVRAGDTAVPDICEGLESDDVQVRYVCAAALRILGSKTAKTTSISRRPTTVTTSTSKVTTTRAKRTTTAPKCELLPPTALGVTYPSLLEVGTSLFTDVTCRFTGNPQRSQSPKASIRSVPCLRVRTAQCVGGLEGFHSSYSHAHVPLSWDSLSRYRTCKTTKDDAVSPPCSLPSALGEDGGLAPAIQLRTRTRPIGTGSQLFCVRYGNAHLCFRLRG